jgi:hypothetical protein
MDGAAGVWRHFLVLFTDCLGVVSGKNSPGRPRDPPVRRESQAGSRQQAENRAKPTTAPLSWDEIDLGHLVPAKEDRPEGPPVLWTVWSLTRAA